MSKYEGHTAGPWHVANGRQIRSHNQQIATTWMFGAGTGKINAQLIADAPMLLKQRDDLLKLLKESTEMLGRIMNNEEWGAIEEQICNNREFILEVLQDS